MDKITFTQIGTGRKVTLEGAEARLAVKIKRAAELKNRGYSNAEIGRRMGIAESTVRSLLKGVRL